MQEVIREKAASLLRDGTVTRILAWKRGELGYDVTPAVFTSEDQLSELCSYVSSPLLTIS